MKVKLIETKSYQSIKENLDALKPYTFERYNK